MTTVERLREMFAHDFDLPAASLTPDATLESLGIDSLRMIEILFAIEDAFKVTVRAEPAELRTRLKTFGDLAVYVDELAAASP
ncbi:MAG TPA: phosphopantetheine-binding protein [Usitatibacter sp.]|nr:phosphopantetheine-binding protein [Usitatibacter sp.]